MRSEPLVSFSGDALCYSTLLGLCLWSAALRIFTQGFGALFGNPLKELTSRKGAVLPVRISISLTWDETFSPGNVLCKAVLFSLLPEWKLLLSHSSAWKIKSSCQLFFVLEHHLKQNFILEYLAWILLVFSVWCMRRRSVNLEVSAYPNLLFKECWLVKLDWVYHSK